MKATGTVRRVDDLGRIVVPKEIRRTLCIRGGDPLLKTSQRQNGTYGYEKIAGQDWSTLSGNSSLSFYRYTCYNLYAPIYRQRRAKPAKTGRCNDWTRSIPLG